MAASQPGPRYNGLWRNPATGVVELRQGGVLALSANGNDVTVADDLTVTGDNLNIRGIAYTWPADNGDPGEVLQTDGSGVLTWEVDATSA